MSKKIQIGDRVRHFRRYPHTVGTVTDIHLPHARVRYDGSNVSRFELLRNMRKVDFLELPVALSQEGVGTFVVGDRVEHTRSVPGNQVGTIIGFTEQGTAVVAFDDNKTYDYPPIYLRKVGPVEDLAGAGREVKKNPGLVPGDKVRHSRRKPVAIGTVVALLTPDHVGVQYEGFRLPVTELIRALEKVTPLEDLAAVGRTQKNPRPRFKIGDRVRCKHYSSDSFGTVRGFSSGMKGWIAVEFDLRREGGPEFLHHGDLEHVTPLEELAVVGKTWKNPKTVSYPEDPGFEVGELVRIKTAQYRGRVARIHYKKSFSVYAVFIEGEPYIGDVEYSYASLEKLSPVEQLALLGKKNPTESFRVGDRVRHVRDTEKWGFATVTALSSHGSTVDIVFDRRPLKKGERATPVWMIDLTHVSPLEELARTGKKNPEDPMIGRIVDVVHLGRSGDTRERTRQEYRRRAEVTVFHREGLYTVCFLDGKEPKDTMVSMNYLERLSPVEEIATTATARKHRTRKNPPRFEPGTRVRVENRPLRGTVLRTHEEFVVVRFDSGEDGWITPERLVVLSPLEELARLARKPRDTGKLKPRTRKNPIVWKAEVGDRVKVERFNGYDLGTMTQKLAGGWCLVKLDKPSLREEFCSPESVSRIGPLEELASLAKESKRNPQPFLPGERVLQPESGRVGMVASVLRTDAMPSAGAVVYVRFDDDEAHDLPVFISTLRRITPVEELALLGKQLRGKKNPSFSVGDRVVFRNAPGCTGTVVWKVSDSFGKLYAIRWDGAQVVRSYRSGELLHLSLLEALAEVGRVKKNPDIFNRGDRVCRTVYSYRRVGTVVHPLVWREKGPTDIKLALVLFDGAKSPVEVPYEQLRQLSPIEELALVGEAPRKTRARRLPRA